ncbi:hypothetical protein D9M70_449960 [compost metagenome]
MDGGDVGGFQRIGQHAHGNALFGQLREVGGAGRGRDEVGRDQVQLALGLAQDLAQLVRDQRVAPRLAQGLGGIVADDARPGPLEFQRAVQHMLHVGHLAQRRHVGGSGRVLLDRAGAAGQLVQALHADRRHQPVHRVRRSAGPVAVEVVRHVGGGGADRNHVQVGEQHAVGGAEVFVADIAPADDRGDAVGGERLVVHAPVQAPEIGQEIERLGLAQHKRVEDPHFDLRMGVHGREQLIHAGQAVVVEQQAHAHAAVGGLVQRLQQQRAGQVVAPDVVLHVERALRRACQVDARGEGGLGVVQRVDAAEPGLAGQRGRDRAAQRRGRGLGGRDGGGFGAVVQRRQRAAAQQGGAAQHQRTGVQAVVGHERSVCGQWHGGGRRVPRQGAVCGNVRHVAMPGRVWPIRAVAMPARGLR